MGIILLQVTISWKLYTLGAADPLVDLDEITNWEYIGPTQNRTRKVQISAH